jgi:hypothetical protein
MAFSSSVAAGTAFVVDDWHAPIILSSPAVLIRCVWFARSCVLQKPERINDQ